MGGHGEDILLDFASVESYLAMGRADVWGH